MKDLRPKTAEEYAKMVEQAIIEVEEAIACMEFEMENEGGSHGYLDPLLQQLSDLRARMADGSYTFRNEDMPFMPLVIQMGSMLPFGHLLSVINQTHRYGLNIEKEA